jgi:hypothetical protein
MLNTAALILKYYLRKVKPKGIQKPEGAEKVKFS